MKCLSYLEIYPSYMLARKSLNSLTNVSPTVGVTVVGVEQTLQSRLTLHLSELEKSDSLESLLRNGSLRIKLSGA